MKIVNSTKKLSVDIFRNIYLSLENINVVISGIIDKEKHVRFYLNSLFTQGILSDYRIMTITTRYIEVSVTDSNSVSSFLIAGTL